MVRDAEGYDPSEIRAAGVSDGDWAGIALAWDALASLPRFLRPAGRGWRYAALWIGPAGEIRALAGSGAVPAACLDAAARLPDPDPAGAGLGRVLACLGMPVRFQPEDGMPPDGWAERALREAGLPIPIARSAALPLADRDLTAREYALVLADASGRLLEMVGSYPALRPFLDGPVGEAYRAGGIPAAARALSGSLGAEVPGALLRRLRGVPVPTETTGEAGRTLRLLAGQPVDLCPTDAQGYAAAAALAEAATLLPDPSLGVGRPARPEALVGRVLKALGAQLPAGDPRRLLTLRDLPGHAERLLSELAEGLVGPALRLHGLDGDPLATAREAFFGGLDLAEAAAAMAERERSRVPQERGMPDPVALDLPWPRPCPDHVAANGLRVVPIGSWRELMREGDPGAGLDHCSGNRAYAASRAAGEAVLLSVRTDEGARLATVELRRSDSGVRIRQFQGRGGARPPEEAQDALRDWCGALAEGAFGIRFEAFDLPLGYDEADPAAVAAALEAWLPLLRGRPGAWADPGAGPAP